MVCWLISVFSEKMDFVKLKIVGTRITTESHRNFRSADGKREGESGRQQSTTTKTLHIRDMYSTEDRAHALSDEMG